MKINIEATPVYVSTHWGKNCIEVSITNELIDTEDKLIRCNTVEEFLSVVENHFKQ